MDSLLRLSTRPAYGVAGVLWAAGLRRLRRIIDPATLPRLAVATAVAFALMLVTVPLPGGTTVPSWAWA